MAYFAKTKCDQASHSPCFAREDLLLANLLYRGTSGLDLKKKSVRTSVLARENHWTQSNRPFPNSPLLNRFQVVIFITKTSHTLSNRN